MERARAAIHAEWEPDAVRSVEEAEEAAGAAQRTRRRR